MSAPGPEVRIGVVTTGDARQAQRLEARPLDSLWVGGHIASRIPSPEAMIGLTRFATVTERVMVGTSILRVPLYPPALIAKQVADLDRATGGRLMLGVGVGGEYPQEFRAVQVPVEERGRRIDEIIPLLRRLWTATEITHDGRYYPMQDVKIHPAPMQAGGPPIVVAGRKEPAMRRAALLGDGWFPYMFSPRRYAESVATITLAASAAGRDLAGFHWCVWVFLNINPDGDVAREEAAPATSCSCPPPAARTTNQYSTSSSTRSCRRSATTQQVPKVGPAERSRRGRSPREWTLGRSRSDGKSTLSLKYSDVSIPDDLKAFVDETCRPLGEPGSLRLSHELGAGFIVMADPEASWRSDRPTTRWPPRRARRPAPLRPKSADGGTDGACAAPAS